MKEREKYFIDLSKCTHNEIMELFSLTRGNYKVVGSFTILHMLDSEWVTATNAVGKTELSYPEFIKLFEGGEGESSDTSKCEQCGGRTALITGTFYYDPHSEPYMNGMQEESNVNGGECWVGAYKCDECSHIQGLWIE